MSELISGKEAKLAWANGLAVQVDIGGGVFEDVTSDCLLCVFDYPGNKFRKTPRTITINGIEVPAPFEPKGGDKYWFMDVNSRRGYEYDVCGIDHFNDEQWSFFGTWRTEEEIKQVVAALRSIFGKK